MELQFSLHPMALRANRYPSDLLSQFLVIRDEKTEAQSVKSFT